MVPHAVPSPAELEAEIALANGPSPAVRYVVTGAVAGGAVGFGAFTALTLWFFIESGAKSAGLVIMGAVYVAILTGVTVLLAHAAWKTATTKSRSARGL
jgi:hypothetical protein